MGQVKEKPGLSDPDHKMSQDPMMALVDKYGQPEDSDVNESLVRILESGDDSERNIAVAWLIAMNDLYSASRISWVAINGSKSARISAVRVLGKLCREIETLNTLVHLRETDKNRDVRKAAAEAIANNGIAKTMERLLNKGDV